jgi:hypothetical protein
VAAQQSDQQFRNGKVIFPANLGSEGSIADIHIQNTEILRNNLLAFYTAKRIDKTARMLLEVGWAKWNTQKTAARIKRFFGKLYIRIQTNLKRGSIRMANTEIKDFQAFLSNLNTDPNLKPIKDAFKDLTTLTIVTTADSSYLNKNAPPPQGVQPSNKTIMTEISILGDVTTIIPMLEGAELVAYHERMTKLSVDIIKTYSLIIIQLVGTFVPFAGLKFPTGFVDNISSLVNSFGMSSGVAAGQAKPP